MSTLSRFQQTLRWFRDPVGLLVESATRLGDCFTLAMAGPPMAVFSHPAHVEQIFEASPDELLGGHANTVFSLAFGPRNLLCLDGEEHARARAHFGAPLAYREIATYSARVEEVVRRHVGGWPAGVAVDLQRLMQRLALDVVLEVLLELPSRTLDQFRPALLDFADRIADIGTRRRRHGAFVKDGPLARSRRRVRRLCEAELSGRICGDGTDGGILNRLASSHEDADLETILDQVVAFLIAGHETTAIALTWAVCRIVGTDGVLTELMTEINEAHAISTSRAFLDATILETLRLHPAFPILPRTVTVPLEIGPYRLAPGDVVAPCSYLSHRHPELWAEPQRFDPRRFMRSRPSSAAFYPFGSGARRCIGMHFALLEMRAVLAETLRRWQVHALTAGIPRPARRSLTLAPEAGFPAVLEPREPARNAGSPVSPNPVPHHCEPFPPF